MDPLDNARAEAIASRLWTLDSEIEALCDLRDELLAELTELLDRKAAYDA